MAILGKLIDKTTVSRAGDAFKGVTHSSLAHSLPATSPDIVLPVLRSVQEVGYQSPIAVIGLGGNASLATIGFVGMSCISQPTIMFDVYVGVIHSLIS